MNYSDLEKVFVDGYVAKSGDYDLVFFKKEICSIKIGSGKIIACDPFLTMTAEEAFTTTFPIGTFPVELAIVNFSGDERIGFARIRFSDAEPIKWTMALWGNQDINQLPPGDIYGYGVDSGTGSFMDQISFKDYLKKFKEVPNYFDVVNQELEKTFRPTWSWLHWESKENDGAIFSSDTVMGFMHHISEPTLVEIYAD